MRPEGAPVKPSSLGRALKHVELEGAAATTTDEQLASLQTQSHELSLNTGEVLFREGDPPQGLYVILDGEVEIVKRIGAQTVVVANVPTGSFVGEISLLTGILEDVTGRVFQDTPSFSRQLLHDPSLADAFHHAHRLVEAGQDPLAAEEAMYSVLSRMFAQYGSVIISPPVGNGRSYRFLFDLPQAAIQTCRWKPTRTCSLDLILHQ